MIIKNNSEVRKIYFGTNPTPMFNYNGSKAFQHIVDEYVPPVFTCPDVVQSIVGYEGDAKEVYAKDTKKWYTRNNLGNYEEYGILEEVQSLDSVTFYEGKLVIFGNHEYESVGGNWVDLGAAQGTTKKIKSPSYIYNDSSHLFSIPVGYTASTDTKLEMKFKATNGNGGAMLGSNSSTDQDDFRIFLSSNTLYYDVPSTSGSYGGRIYGGSYLGKDADIEFGNFYIKDLSTGTNVVTGATQTYQCDSTLIVGQSTQFGHGSNDTFQLSALTMYHGGTLERDFLPAIDGNDICLYDKVSDAYFKSDNGKMPLSGGTITEVEVGTIEYPKDYDQKDAPEDNVTVESLDQIECPYEGMTAYVNGVKYTYENGEWIEQILGGYITGTSTSNNFTVKINGTNVSPSFSDNGNGYDWSVYVGSGDMNIDNFASGNIAITSAWVSGEIQQLRQYAFYGCTNLTAITLNEGTVKLRNQSLTYSGLLEIEVKDGIDVGNAISQISNLRSVILPATLTSITTGAFNGCQNMQSLTILATTPPATLTASLNNGSYPIYVPDGSVDAYKAASGWSSYASRIKGISEKS